jgi:hypothetical protein
MRDILTSLKEPVAVRAIRHLRRYAPAFLEKLTVVHKSRIYHRFWQAGSGHDENLDDPQAIHNIIDYIHQNPKRRGLVARAEDWIWSSARDWAGLPSPLIQVDRTVPTLYIIEEQRKHRRIW